MGNLPGRSNLQLQAAAPPRHHGNHRAVPRRWGPGDAWDGGPGPSDGKHRDGLHHEKHDEKPATCAATKPAKIGI